jgi:2-hydroxy-3-keto-5-methylthiopentenyl-1-phosphate phosphatase
MKQFGVMEVSIIGCKFATNLFIVLFFYDFDALERKDKKTYYLRSTGYDSDLPVHQINYYDDQPTGHSKHMVILEQKIAIESYTMIDEGFSDTSHFRLKYPTRNYIEREREE